MPIEGKQAMIDTLLFIRKNKAYGLQDDYFDHENVIGWVRRGAKEVENFQAVLSL